MPKLQSLECKIAPPLQVLILAAVGWLVHVYAPYPHFHFPYQTLVAGILALVGVAVFVVAVVQFFQHKTTINPMKIADVSVLMTNGIFSVSRNPIYLGDLLLLLAWVVYLGQWLNLIIPLLFFAYCTEFQIKPEERVLKAKFQDHYHRYCHRVRRWV